MILERSDYIPLPYRDKGYISVVYTPEKDTTLGEVRRMRGSIIMFEEVNYNIVGIETYAQPDHCTAHKCSFLLKVIDNECA